MNKTENKTWNVAVLNIDWRADRHDESHSIEFERPTADNPNPEHPVVVGEVLSTSRLPMSGEWGHLFASVVVKAFDEESLTVQYGANEYVIRPGDPWKKLGEGGMSYTTFWLFLGVKYVKPKPKTVVPKPLEITHDEQFLRHFRVKERVMRLTEKDVELLCKAAGTGDAFAQYGLGRWLYFMAPTSDAVREAEALFLTSKNHVADSMAAYAVMWRYGETKETEMDLEKSNQLLQEALQRGSERAAQQLARARIFGQFREAEPEVVAKEIEQRLDNGEDYDPHWHTLLAFAYEELGRSDDAIGQYEQAIDQGEYECYAYLAYIYRQRGNMALYDSLMEEGIKQGSTICMLYQADMEEEAFQELDEAEQQQLHETIDRRLHQGMAKGDGACAFYLWLQYYYGGLGYVKDLPKSFVYLKRGVELGDSSCIRELVDCSMHGELPPEMALDATEEAELRLRAVRYHPNDETSLRRLRLVSDPAFLLKHKGELERYWQPKFDEIDKADEEYKRNSPFRNEAPKVEKTPIEPSVIVIWPTGHLDIVEADVYKMKSFRDMAQTLIGGEGLDGVYYSLLLDAVGKAAGLDMPLVMYVDRDGCAKDLPDNAIGTQLYGQGQEVRGPIIVCQQDDRHECHSFAFQEDLVATYNEINSRCGGLLIVKDEDDGRWDAYA